MNFLHRMIEARKARRARRTGTQRLLKRACRGLRAPLDHAFWALLAILMGVPLSTLLLHQAVPAGRWAAWEAFIWGFLFPGLYCLIIAQFLLIGPRAALLGRLKKAGFDNKAVRDAARLAEVVHGPAVMFWRVPRAETLEALPGDPEQRGWSFVRLLHRYQYRKRMPADGGDHPALRAGRRGRTGVLGAWGLMLVVLAWPVGAGLTKVPEGLREQRFQAAQERFSGSGYRMRFERALQQGRHAEALRIAEEQLATHPEARSALRAAAKASAELGRYEDARDYALRLVAVEQESVTLRSPRAEQWGSTWRFGDDLRHALVMLKEIEVRIEDGER